jgi:hypothetical protein
VRDGRAQNNNQLIRLYSLSTAAGFVVLLDFCCHERVISPGRFLPDNVGFSISPCKSILSITDLYHRSSLEESDRKLEKSKNKHGNPIKLPSKILAVTADPQNSQSIYVAESCGVIRRVSLEVGEQNPRSCLPRLPSRGA